MTERRRRRRKQQELQQNRHLRQSYQGQEYEIEENEVQRLRLKTTTVTTTAVTAKNRLLFRYSMVLPFILPIMFWLPLVSSFYTGIKAGDRFYTNVITTTPSITTWKKQSCIGRRKQRVIDPIIITATRTTTSKQRYITAHGTSSAEDNYSKTSNDNNIDDADIDFLVKEVNVHYGVTSPLQYDPELDRYVNPKKLRQRKDVGDDDLLSDNLKKINSLKSKILRRLSVAFLPDGVNQNYYPFMRWRICQRVVNANLQVIGTQSLLLGLGIKSKAKTSASALGVSAALYWVLKDALGKIARMVWASYMGRRFDSDAKRWRYRSSLLFAVGNWLEIVTYIYPQWFLLYATIANCCKQVAMLTSSSTRTALYNSFRDGSRENIGDITAKGEAQIAIVDLIGIISGVCLTSHVIGTSIQNVITAYITLQVLEITCMYYQIRTIIFRVLNFERLSTVVNTFVQHTKNLSFSSSSKNNINNETNDNDTKTPTDATTQQQKQQQQQNEDDVDKTIIIRKMIPTPDEIASIERVFLPPKHLTRRALAFGSLGRAKVSPEELLKLSKIFSNERFILVVGRNMKKESKQRQQQKLLSKRTTTTNNNNKLRQRRKLLEKQIEIIKENCHIVLHEDATNTDIVKSTLALLLLRQKLQQKYLRAYNNSNNNTPMATTTTTTTTRDKEQVEQQQQQQYELRSSDCYDLLKEVCIETNQKFPSLLEQFTSQGWAPPDKFMFGRVQMRAQWPLSVKIDSDDVDDEEAK